MDVEAVEQQVVRLIRGRSFRAAAEPDDLAIATRVRLELEELQLPVVGPCRRLQRRVGVGRLDLWQQGGIAGRHAHTRGGQRAGRRRRAHDDERAAALLRQDEVAGERRSRLEEDGVAGHRLVQRRLQIATGIDSDGRGVGGRSESHRERRREQNVSRPNHWHQ